MLNEYLKQLGFNEKEISVYLCIIEKGKISAAQVSKITKINRTTVYSVSKELVKKGVITEDLGGANRYFIGLPVNELKDLFKKEEEEIKEKKKILDNLIGELESLPKSKQYSVPKIRFIDERHLNDFLYKQLPVWIESAKNGDKNWWGFQDSSFIDSYPEWFKYHWEIYPKDYGAYLFTNKKPAEEKFSKHIKDNVEGSDKRRNIKYWADSKEFTATHAVLGDYVVFIVTSQRPHYMVEIHDSVMANNIREMFKGVWGKI